MAGLSNALSCDEVKTTVGEADLDFLINLI